MHRLGYLLLAVILILPVQSAAEEPFISVTPDPEAIEDMRAVLVDIRQPQEWRETGIVEDSLTIAFNDPQAFVQDLAPYLKGGKPAALICRSGHRSRNLARYLGTRLEVGVINIEGGIVSLLRRGYETIPYEGNT